MDDDGYSGSRRRLLIVHDGRLSEVKMDGLGAGVSLLPLRSTMMVHHNIRCTIAAADQKRAYPTAVSIGVTARMIWEVCWLTVTIEERRRRLYDGRTIRWIVATSFISGGVV